MKLTSLSKLDTHVWLAGFANIFGLTFQLYTLIHNHTSEGISLVMCFTFGYIQFVYGRLGQKTNNKPLMWCLYISFIIQMIIIIYVIKMRHSP